MSAVPVEPALLYRRHLRFGWWSLLVFLSLGIALEAMHGLKLGLYLDVSNSTRRFVWTLSHAHGTLLALVNLGFAFSVRATQAARWMSQASTCLIASSVLLPGGFFLGGIWFYGGDPGLGIVLVPVGAFLLLAGVYLTARGLSHPSA